MRRLILFTFLAFAAGTAVGADSSLPPKEVADCYVPVEGGWRIRITSDPASPRLKPGSAIGVVVDDPRQHRRPLYPPPTDRSCGPRRNSPSASESLVGPWFWPPTSRGSWSIWMRAEG